MFTNKKRTIMKNPFKDVCAAPHRGEKLRILIHGSEHKRHAEQFVSIKSALENTDAECIYFISNTKAVSTDFTPKNFFLHKFRDILWDKFGLVKNNFNKNRWDWSYLDGNGKFIEYSPENPLSKSWSYWCKPIKCNLPWKPDVVLCISPHEGHTKYQLIPWANKNEIPVISIDHGCPMTKHDFGEYRGSMMGCVANIVWGREAVEINASYGAPSELQIPIGSPALDDLGKFLKKEKKDMQLNYGIEGFEKVILLMTTHREPLKSHCDLIFKEIVEKYSTLDSIKIVVKPHPTELLNGSLMSFPENVMVITSQSDLHQLIAMSDLVVSPASSTIIPAMGLKIPYVNLLQPGMNLPNEQKYIELNKRLGEGILSYEQMDAFLKGDVSIDYDALEDAFTRYGTSLNGNNGMKIVELCEFVASGKNVMEFKI